MCVAHVSRHDLACQQTAQLQAGAKQRVAQHSAHVMITTQPAKKRNTPNFICMVDKNNIDSMPSGAHAACKQASNISRPEVKPKLAAGGARTHRAQHRDEALCDQEREQPAVDESTSRLIDCRICTSAPIAHQVQCRNSQGDKATLGLSANSQVDADVDALSSRPRLQRVDLRWDLQQHSSQLCSSAKTKVAWHMLIEVRQTPLARVAPTRSSVGPGTHQPAQGTPGPGEGRHKDADEDDDANRHRVGQVVAVCTPHHSMSAAAAAEMTQQCAQAADETKLAARPSRQ